MHIQDVDTTAAATAAAASAAVEAAAAEVAVLAADAVSLYIQQTPFPATMYFMPYNTVLICVKEHTW